MTIMAVCFWCDQPFRRRQSGGLPQRFCRPFCRRAFHAAARAWALDAMVRDTLILADIKNSVPATRALVVNAIATARILEESPGHATVPAAADEAILLLEELSMLLGNILDTLTPEELGLLPEPVWALLDFIAGSDTAEATAL